MSEPVIHLHFAEVDYIINCGVELFSSAGDKMAKVSALTLSAVPKPLRKLFKKHNVCKALRDGLQSVKFSFNLREYRLRTSTFNRAIAKLKQTWQKVVVLVHSYGEQ